MHNAQTYNRDLHQCKDDINVIYELLAVSRGNLELDLFSNSGLEFMYYFSQPLQCNVRLLS